MKFLEFCKNFEVTPDEVKLLAVHLCTIRTAEFMKQAEKIWIQTVTPPIEKEPR